MFTDNDLEFTNSLNLNKTKTNEKTILEKKIKKIWNGV